MTKTINRRYPLQKESSQQVGENFLHTLVKISHQRFFAHICRIVVSATNTIYMFTKNLVYYSLKQSNNFADCYNYSKIENCNNSHP